MMAVDPQELSEVAANLRMRGISTSAVVLVRLLDPSD